MRRKENKRDLFIPNKCYQCLWTTYKRF